ncbi:MAG: GAF domain-containing protein [Anaerolineales bacterium]|nr:GAF domain-containing protein [Anaerolineales bacterium]
MTLSNLKSPPPAGKQSQTQNIAFIGGVFALVFGGLTIYALLTGPSTQALYTLPVFAGSLLTIWLARNKRAVIGSVVLILAVALQTILSPFFEAGISVPMAVTALGAIGIISLGALPRNVTGRIFIGGLIIASAALLIDLFAQGSRAAVSAGVLSAHWIVSVGLFIVFIIYLAREFSTLDIRTKITLGILATGGIALASMAGFAINRAEGLTGYLSEKLSNTVKAQAEEQLTNVVSSQAVAIDAFFQSLEAEVTNVAAYRASLEAQKEVLGSGAYWDATTHVFQLSGGQYGNSKTEPASLYAPADLQLTEATFQKMNVSAYLDFVAPKILKSRPEVLSVYEVTPEGITRYYPNVDLANVVPPGFNAANRPYYQITTPDFNPDRKAQWAIPYVDAAGGGLVVTVTAPIYAQDQFQGIIAADIQLIKVADQVAKIKIGRSGYAMVLDDDGHIISMPPAGYAMYELNPENLPPEDYDKQIVIGIGGKGIQSVTNRMVAGGAGLATIQLNGVDTYISYTQIPTSHYILAVVVPVSEMQQAIQETNQDVQAQTQNALRLGAVIFIALLFFAVIISILISQIIALPILRLTLAANRIIEGYLTTQAIVTTEDEIGTLGRAFNTMTYRLRESLTDLEARINQRTSEIKIANEKIERRARQFASISEVSRIINQAQNLEDLLPDIAQVISEQFNFYHVGVFLLDLNKEYAVLRAANSTGGQTMLSRGHKLLIGQTGIVGYTAGTGKARVALDTGSDSVYFNNPDLPNTHSEIALPLLKSGEIIGVLDVQSTEPNAFSQEDIEILSTLADQVAVAITNATLYEETQRTLMEGDLIYRQNLKAGWERFTRSLNLVGIKRKGLQTSLLTEPLELQEDRHPAQSNGHIHIPIKLRGEKIGLLRVENKEKRQLTQDELDVISAILERAALSMENARLLEESQRRAAREQIIQEMSTKIGSGTEIESILKTAARELGAQIGGAQITVELGGADE